MEGYINHHESLWAISEYRGWLSVGGDADSEQAVAL
jgi:hypothetical protein